MRSLLRSACGALSVAVVAALALAVLSAQAQTPAGVTVTIQPAGGGTPATISTADIPNGDMNTTYTVGSQKVAVKGGVSIYQLLDKANANFGYAEIEIPRTDGSTLRMTKAQVESTKPAGFFTDDQGVTRFIGPTASNGSVAASDYFAVGATIALTQLREPKLKVTISPSKKKIALGGSVTFKAKVTGNEPGETVTYKWWLAGEKQKFGGPSFEQRFPKKDGVYKLSVAVRIDGSGASTTAVAKITVGDPKKADEEQVGNGDATSGSDGGTSGSGGDSGYDSGSSYTPSYAPSTPTPAPTPAPTPTPEPPKQPDIATSGATVQGNLLADVSDPTASSILESAAKAAREGAQKDDKASSDGAGVSEAALSFAGVLALLALGAGIETRQGRLPRLRLPRRGA